MSPCEEGMSPYLIKFENVPPLSGFKKVVLETNAITIAVLDKHVDGRPKYISCWVEFLKFIKRELISRLQMHTSYIQERHTYN